MGVGDRVGLGWVDFDPKYYFLLLLGGFVVLFYSSLRFVLLGVFFLALLARKA